jgi:hypothetical protein
MAKSILILIVFIFVVFSPCLKAGFLDLDDDAHIAGNSAVYSLSPSSIKQMFTQRINGVYIPLTTLSFAIEKHFFGFNPLVFHLDNLLVYTGVVILVLLLANRMGLSLEASFLAALIFAIHPMRVESVAWACERKDVLYALFYLLALHQYWSYLKTSSIKYYFSTFFFGFISILCKPMALSLPLILLVFDWFYGRRFNKQVFLEKVPILLCVLSFTWFVIFYALTLRHPHGYEGILIFIWSFCFYLWKFLFPFQVCPYYALPLPISIIHWPYFLSVMFILVLALLIVRFHKNKLFIFAVLFYFCSIFFLLRFNNVFFTVVCDRYMFLPSLGICLFAGSWIDRRIKTRLGIMILYILLILMGMKTNFQCRIWHDSISFWSEVILQQPDYYRAYIDRGAVLFQQEHDDLALKDFNKAIALNPKAEKAYNNRGIIYYLRVEDSKALGDFNKAISLDPAYPEPYVNRSLLRNAQKNYQQALKDALYAKKLGGSVDEGYLKGLRKEIEP